MPVPAAPSRIAGDAFIIPAQATVQPSPSGEGATGQPAVAPGSERAEGAFGLFGMMTTGLIIIFAVVLLVLRYRRRL